MDTPALTIGEFARRSRLTVKALRLYDELDLLAPDHVDPASGYRYYRPEQLERARTISLLRRLEMPLQEIAVVLETRDTDRVRRWWAEVEREHELRRGTVRYLEQAFDDRGAPMFEIMTRQVEEASVATISRRVLQPALPTFIPEALAALREHIAACGARGGEVDWVVYHGDVSSDSQGLVEVCVPFDGTVTATTTVAVRVEPAHQEAYTRLTKGQVGPPDGMHAFDAVGRWLEEHGKVPTLDPREVYFADWVAISDDTPACDVAFPFTDAP